MVSTHYRQGPEHKFPAAHDDTFSAYRWALDNAKSLNADPARIAVAGESAGGNLAAVVAMRARDEKVTMPFHQLLVYPIAGSDGEMLAQRLRDAGVSVRHRTFDGVTHEFFGMGAVVDKAKAAVQFAADGLKAGFAGRSPHPSQD